MRFTIYKNSVGAWILSVLGAASFYFGILMIMIAILDPSVRKDLGGLIVMCIISIVIGVCLQLWARKIAEKKARKQDASDV